ncbi:hypothetical protein AWU65_23250 [Paenibacillus glucanolyticus]|uniref:Uncharacterized protein n=1 Tax=Paenibacillus glucanolyticus TaxID=59843 RepID=A0A163M0U0_9BACL|nr:hypothetical protein B9D94_15140 [Paenibacillus sp. Cedars]KZS48640.1 hypothetical protein AWU65_23250 [Paenibacillus glucanolyticus]
MNKTSREDKHFLIIVPPKYEIRLQDASAGQGGSATHFTHITLFIKNNIYKPINALTISIIMTSPKQLQERDFG